MGSSIFKILSGCLVVLSILICASPVRSQDLEGRWHGIFMDQFPVDIDFTTDTYGNWHGRLQMNAGEAIIQDDTLTGIIIKNGGLVFLIPAKNTEFQGVVNDQFSQIRGHFIFPDGSKHGLLVKKATGSTIGSEAVSFQKLKTRMFPAEELNADLDFLKEALEKNHPQLYSCTSKEAFDNTVDQTRSAILPEMNLNDFFVLISPVLESVGCSHTGIRMPGYYEEALMESGNFFPLKMAFINNHAYFLPRESPTEVSLDPGAEIISINGRSMKEIMEVIFTMIPAECDNLTTRYFEINQNFAKYFFLIDDSAFYEVEYTESSDPQIQSLRIPAVKYSEILPDPEFNQEYRVQIDPARDLAILTLPTFGIRDINAYIHRMDSIFSHLNSLQIRNLCIDLRGNHGGHPIFAAQLLSYLVDKEFTYFKRNSEVPEFEPLYNPMQPNSIHYGGNSFIFIDGGCLSTSGHFISLFQFYNIGQTIGEQPGSLNSCNDFSVQLTLPNTGIQMNIPRTTFETAVKGFEKYAQAKINFELHQTVESRLTGRDIYKEKLYSLLITDPVK